MPPYVMRLLAKGHKMINVNENTFMIKYCGYFLINLSKKEIKSVVKKPDCSKSKTISFPQTLKKDMEMSVKKLLDNYFSKEQIRDALREIGEPASGNKDRLARRLRDHWESHNRDIYELLNFTDVDSLDMICHHYKLDATFKEKDALKGKTENAHLLVLDKKPSAVIDKSYDSPKTKTNISSEISNRKSNSKKPKTKPKVDDNELNHKKPKTNQRRGFSLKKLLYKLTQQRFLKTERWALV